MGTIGFHMAECIRMQRIAHVAENSPNNSLYFSSGLCNAVLDYKAPDVKRGFGRYFGIFMIPRSR
jgi:hypothetical protein